MDNENNQKKLRPLYISFFKGFAFGLFAVLLKLAVSFSIWRTYAANSALGEFENFAIHIISFIASLFVFNSAIGISMTYDPYSRDELLERTFDRKGLIPSFSGIYFYNSFFAEALGIILVTSIAALLGSSPEIFGMFYFDEGVSPFSSGILPALVTAAITSIFCFFARFEAARYWKTLYRTANLEIIESKVRIIGRIAFITVLYPICLPYLPILASIAVLIFGVVARVAEAMTIPGFILAIIALTLLLWYIKVLIAVRKRRKFIKKLGERAGALGYTVSKMQNPFRSLLSAKHKCTFRVERGEKKYSCVIIGNPRYRVPICFTTSGEGYFRHRLGTPKHNLTLQTKFNYTVEGEGKKIIVISPTAKDTFVTEDGKEKRLFNADRIWDSVIYEADAFIAAIERDCLGRYD